MSRTDLCNEQILGYPVITSVLDDCVAAIITDMKKKDRQCWLVCLNPHSYAVSLKDNLFSQALHAADWVIPDGAGIVLASRMYRGEIRQRITGSDIFYALNSKMNELGGFSVFFLGSTSENLADIKARMARDYPNIRFAGSYSPPYRPEFNDEDVEAMVAAINLAKPDVLWVGMTAPKQEKLIHQHLPRMNVRFAAAVGAVFDFYTGNIKRSHPLFQKYGLEWLPRLLQEPRRLWRRNFISTPIFLWHVICRKDLRTSQRHY